MKKLKIFAIILLLTIASCKKKNADPEPTLPPETQNGANTFGCILNGQLWTNSPREAGGIPTLEATPETGGILTIRALYRDNNRDEMIGFFSQNISSTGTYNLSNITSAIFTDYEKNINYASYDNDIIYSGSIVITRFDIPNRVLSGRFSFKLQKQGGLTFEAKEGRFDITMN
ncbi:MAG: hypothetical protein EAZ31_10540 [Cytophagia bacterium]|nr:MAG: hypothetical protein EAZ31_10540 [Cytophagia bacterium]